MRMLCVIVVLEDFKTMKTLKDKIVEILKKTPMDIEDIKPLVNQILEVVEEDRKTMTEIAMKGESAIRGLKIKEVLDEIREFKWSKKIPDKIKSEGLSKLFKSWQEKLQ